MGWVIVSGALLMMLAIEVRANVKLRRRLSECEASYVAARTIAAGLFVKRFEAEADSAPTSEVKRDQVH
jgi:hypothetical protein